MCVHPNRGNENDLENSVAVPPPAVHVRVQGTCTVVEREWVAPLVAPMSYVSAPSEPRDSVVDAQGGEEDDSDDVF